MFDGAGVAIEDIVDEAFDLNVIWYFDENDWFLNGDDVVGVIGDDIEVVGLFCCPCLVFFWGEEEIFDDEVVLGDAFEVFISEYDFFGLIDLKLDG